MYGVQARLPSELRYDDNADSAYDDDAIAAAVVERATKATETLMTLRGAAKENIERAQAKQKVQYYVKRRAPCFNIGDHVMRYNRRRDTRKGGKLNKHFDGPFVVSEVMGKGV